MRLLPFFAAIAAFATTTFAQGVSIGAPSNHASVTPGKSLKVRVDKPDTLTGSEEVAIVIAMHSCTKTCPSPSDVLGHVLYNGPYNPKFSGAGVANETFVVKVPELKKGKAILSVTHLNLVGAGPFPFLQFVNATLNVR